jgi:hypothetical protein
VLLLLEKKVLLLADDGAFLEEPLPVAMVTAEHPNELRDLGS